MAVGKTMLSSVVFFACLHCLQGKDVDLRGSGRGAAVRQLRDADLARSCGDGMTVTIKAPWEDMDAYVDGASSLEACQTCADTLESQGLLMNGWQCHMWWGWTYLKRPGQIDLTPVKALHSFKIADVQAAGPLQPGSAPLPEAIRGIFWLSDQKTQSALMTFAPNNHTDGPWCSYGSLILNRYLVRVDGDRVWSFATADNAGFDLASGLRLVYDFSFDSTTDPTHATIYPIPTILGGSGLSLSKQTWLLTFDMTRLSSNEATNLGYEGSVVWERRSYVFGLEITSSRYHLVQVVDENGKRIEPAWNKFVDYQNGPETGEQAGTLFYHADE